MKIKSIHPREILPDFSFCFMSEKGVYSESDLAGIEQAIKLSGIRTPLFVIQQPSGYQLLEGFKRYTIAQRLEMDSIPVQIVSHDSMPEAFYQVIVDQLAGAGFNLVQKSRILSIASEWRGDHPDLYGDILHLLEIPNHQERMAQVLNILDFHPELKSYIEKYDLSLKQIQPFFLLSQEEQSLAAELGFSLQIRGVELIQIIEWAGDIAKRDDVTMPEVFDQIKIQKLYQDDTSRNDKINQLKKRLLQIRYPKLTELNETFQDLHKQLNLPAQLKISWDKYYESQGLQLNGQIRNRRDFEAIRKFFADKNTGNIIEQMIESV